MVARARAGMGGETELRGILKTFAILLIFFLKWVKLFYDFRRVLLPPRLLSPSSPLFRGVAARVTPESNPRPPPSRSRHREKCNSLFVSFSPPPLPPGHHLCLLLLNRFSLNPPTPLHPTPFLSRLLYATESISRVFSRASPPLPLPPPHLPPGGLFPRTVRKVSASSAPEPLDLDTLPTPSADHFIFYESRDIDIG